MRWKCIPKLKKSTKMTLARRRTPSMDKLMELPTKTVANLPVDTVTKLREPLSRMITRVNRVITQIIQKLQLTKLT
jgi:hypothetical protein